MTLIARPGDEQTSANDVQKWREQDLHIARITSAFDDMLGPCWKVVTSVDDSTRNELLARSSGIAPSPWTRVAVMLSQVRGAFATVGETRNTAINGSTHYITAGNCKVVVPTADNARALSAQLNEDYRKIVAFLADNYLAALRSFANGARDLSGVDEWRTLVWSGPQSRVWVPDGATGLAIAKALNESYEAATQGAKDELLHQLSLATGG